MSEPHSAENDQRERIAALPEAEATKSRDYGRGYARAIKDVLALLEADRYRRGVNA